MDWGMQQVQVCQWVYGLQCVELHSLLDEEGKRLGRKIAYEYTLAAQIAAGKDKKSKQSDQNDWWMRGSAWEKG